MRMSRGIWVAGALTLAAVGIFAYWNWAPASVIVDNPRFGPAVQAVYATGTVEPVVMLPVAPRIGAKIVQLLVDEGAVVKAGQILARLESEDVRNNVAQLEAQEDFAHRDFLRDAALVSGGVISRQTYDKAKSAWDAARAAVASARAQIGYMTLTAPTDGRVIRRDGEVGQFLPINQPLFWLSCLSPLRISADVDEEDIALVKPGQRVLIRADAFPGRMFNGHVQEITPKGDPIARSYRVRITLDSPTPLQIGMTTETNIVTYEKPRALLVPASAVAASRVFVLHDGHARRVSVTEGIVGKSEIEITRGLTSNDLVIVKPDPALSDGARVEPVRADSSP